MIWCAVMPERNASRTESRVRMATARLGKLHGAEKQPSVHHLCILYGVAAIVFVSRRNTDKLGSHLILWETRDKN